jgi:hypothetical protein
MNNLKEKADFAWRELIYVLSTQQKSNALWRHGKLQPYDINNFAKVKWTNQILFYK